MNWPVGTQRVEAPGEAADTRCCSGRVVCVVEGSQTEAQWADSLGNSPGPAAGRAQGGRSICGLESDSCLIEFSVLSWLFFFSKVISSFLTFINLPDVSEVGVQLCRRTEILWLIWNNFHWGLWKRKKRFCHRESWNLCLIKTNKNPSLLRHNQQWKCITRIPFYAAVNVLYLIQQRKLL